MKITVDEASALAQQALEKSGASAYAARSTAAALVRAEIDGQRGHGLTRVQSYSAQVRTGKVNGQAQPAVTRLSDAAIVIDADHGLTYPAIDLAIEDLSVDAASQSIAAAGIKRAHHFGQAGAHAERLAERGLVSFVFGNSPKGIAFWGSSKPMMGTNPIAFAAPIAGRAPLVIDLALSVTARGKIIAASKEGRPIPEGWALDADGNPTTNPHDALEGSMIPVGGAKGAALALMVEVLAAAVTGSAFGFEASSLFTAEGDPPNLGQVIIALDPGRFSNGHFDERMAVLVQEIHEATGARVPGDSRLARREKVKNEGLDVPDVLYEELQAHVRGEWA